MEYTGKDILDEYRKCREKPWKTRLVDIRDASDLRSWQLFTAVYVPTYINRIEISYRQTVTYYHRQIYDFDVDNVPVDKLLRNARTLPEGVETSSKLDAKRIIYNPTLSRRVDIIPILGNMYSIKVRLYDADGIESRQQYRIEHCFEIVEVPLEVRNRALNGHMSYVEDLPNVNNMYRQVLDTSKLQTTLFRSKIGEPRGCMETLILGYAEPILESDLNLDFDL